MKAEILDKIASQISALLPDQAGQDMKNNIQQILARQLNKMDVVSRDDFEAQQAVLLRTREKLEALEKQVAALEALIQP
ncbi:MAG: accessory factor UbiK family protein [Gammaproteobacteria bacterium]|nr:accessory factor UbiK family protein [Gammaproteobacteria bacterium]